MCTVKYTLFISSLKVTLQTAKQSWQSTYTVVAQCWWCSSTKCHLVALSHFDPLAWLLTARLHRQVPSYTLRPPAHLRRIGLLKQLRAKSQIRRNKDASFVGGRPKTKPSCSWLVGWLLGVDTWPRRRSPLELTDCRQLGDSQPLQNKTLIVRPS